MDPELQPGLLHGFALALYFSAVLFMAFQVKHLVVDFFLQNRFPYMWQNKGHVLHPGGWLHAGSHALASALILGYIGWQRPELTYYLVLVCGSELFLHFGIDALKVNLCEMLDWKANTSPYFWDTLGVDQFLHQMTYLYMLYLWYS